MKTRTRCYRGRWGPLRHPLLAPTQAPNAAELDRSRRAATLRRLHLATASDLLTISFLVEQDPAEAAQMPFPLRADEEIRKAVLAAVAAVLSYRPDVRVKWSSSSIVPLDGKPGVGRCAVCNRWVSDVENATDLTPTEISRGAVVEGRYRCDEHLPHGHPLCFAGRGYDGPVPDAGG
jgi:hypothetical protein